MTKYAGFIGRFQPLHRGHTYIIDKMIEDGFTPVIFIGSPDSLDTDRNPYTFKERRSFIHSIYPDIEVLRIFDNVSDGLWVKDLIARTQAYSITSIYYFNKREDRDEGGSYHSHYIPKLLQGKIDLVEVQDTPFNISATQVRETIKHVHKSTFQHIHNNKYLQIKEVKGKYSVYYYAERLGVDSIAFILWDSNKQKYGLIREYKPPIGDYLVTAFGGSLDDYSKSILEIVIMEVEEESGYIVTRDNISSYGKRFVSTQMNQFCHLFLVDISDEKFIGRSTEDLAELDANVVWLEGSEVDKLEDWKAQIICAGEGIIK